MILNLGILLTKLMSMKRASRFFFLASLIDAASQISSNSSVSYANDCKLIEPRKTTIKKYDRDSTDDFGEFKENIIKKIQSQSNLCHFLDLDNNFSTF